LVASGAIATAMVVGGMGVRTAGASQKPVTTISVVAAENEYGNVASQIGGRYVHVVSIESNPNVDPHSYEVSPRVAQEVSSAQTVIQNGIGYDDFMNKIEAASPNHHRVVIEVQHLLGLPDNTPNPHLWYRPTTMPKVVAALVSDFSRMNPAQASFFKSRASVFDASLLPWLHALSQFKTTYPHTSVATTEPVADYMLQAAGTDNKTPFPLQADIMNGVDPAPQDVSLQNGLFAHHNVKVFVYNQQVTDPLTQSFIAAAKMAHVPVIGAYETMPAPGYDYQSWMLAEVRALLRAVADHVSTSRL
jgi:zinc/manganese transport system substrate-binding protein